MKLQYTDLELKTKRAFSNKFFKENNISYETITETQLLALNTFLSENRTSERRQAFYEMLISETTLEKNLLLRYNKYLNAKMNTLEFFRLKFGDKLGEKRYNSNNSKRGRGNTLEGLIEKHGLEEGTKRHSSTNKKRAHTLENFVRIYGEDEGKVKYDILISKKGGSMLKKLSDKYGEIEGTKRFENWKDSCLTSEDNFIKRHGEILGKQKWEEFKDKAKTTKANFIRRHGEQLGIEKWEIYIKKISNTKENFIRVHGLEEGQRRWDNYKNSNAGYKASKQSLEFFEPLTKHLMDKGLELEDIWFGSTDSIEYKIEEGDKVYSYDYTILPLKLIFEFNGNHVHPSKKLLGKNWDNWKCAWSGETADEKHSQDMKKLKIAERNGFTVIEIWDFKNFSESLEECKKLVEERI